MNKLLQKTLVSSCLIISVNTAMADIINFHFTGRLTVSDLSQNIIANPDDPNAIDLYGYQTAIGANLTYDTALGTGSTTLAFDADFWGTPVSIHDINLNFTGDNIIQGSMIADWNGSSNTLETIWDASGFFNAINIEGGLQAGDRISGTNLYRNDVFMADVGSATPMSDSFINPNTLMSYDLNQGPAPLATIGGVLTEGAFTGIQVHLDIGSGNSLYVDSISAVPVPAAVWLFGSGLLGLIGIARRKKA